MLPYIVYRKVRNGFRETARTEFIEDAKKVLTQWHSGYIIRDSDIVFSKNMEL